MKGLIVAVAALLMAPMGMAAAQQAAQPLNAEAAKSLADFLNFGPHRAFVIGADGRASWYVGVGGADPGNAISSALKRCEERGKPPCTLHVVNNYTVTGADWRAQVPARAADAPDIGRLRPEPYWSMRGPKLAAGLIVWSHGYMAGKNATSGAPQSWIGRFTRMATTSTASTANGSSTGRAMPRRWPTPCARHGKWAIAASCWPGSRPAPGCRWRGWHAARRSTA